jgi:hypothetical protein
MLKLVLLAGLLVRLRSWPRRQEGCQALCVIDLRA